MAAKYITIAKELLAELRTMQKNGRDKLPSEAELCRRFSCSRQTVRSALSSLEENGFIVKKKGSGSYLSDPAVLSREIALIIPDKNEYIYPEIIRDIQHILSDKGYTLHSYSTDGLFLNERDILTELLENPPAGIIMEAQNNSLACHNKDLLAKIGEKGIPVVYMHCAYDYPANASIVTQDNFGGAYHLIEHLAAKGHKNIAGIMKCNDTRGVERYAGCVQASLDLGINFREDNYYWFSSEDRRMLLDDNDSPLHNFIRYYLGNCTAVVCYNDEIAYYLIHILNYASIDVPKKVAVVSFDNSYYSVLGDTKITSLGHESHITGTTAAQSLLALIAGQKPKKTILPWFLTQRSSD